MGFNFELNAKTTLATIIIYGDTNVRQLQYNELVHEFKDYQIDKDFKISTDVVGLMAEVNKMVKDKNCPNNLRNRFYKRKLSVIEELVREGRVDDIYKEGYCYSISIDGGKYHFHQLIDDHPEWDNKFDVQGVREFTPSEPAPFDKEKYNEFMLSAVLYLAQKRKELNDMLISISRPTGRKKKKNKQKKISE